MWSVGLAPGFISRGYAVYDQYRVLQLFQKKSAEEYSRVSKEEDEEDMEKEKVKSFCF